MHAIPTTYKGIRFRSRLEAKWAAMFDVMKWPWEYEPEVELKGYIPDFVLTFPKATILAEIKPALDYSLAALAVPIKKIEQSGWMVEPSDDDCTCDDDYNCNCKVHGNHPGPGAAMILGARIIEYQGPRQIGVYYDDSVWSCREWRECLVVTCKRCGLLFPYVDCGERSCIHCGSDDKHYGGAHFPVEECWHNVQNAFQWQPR